ncbi:MAG: chromosome condensation regulator RCC1 [Chloroflexi bacterium]|nr:MAG: chromosome condensation regulator RCC1 [Chloroflexota bacterium]
MTSTRAIAILGSLVAAVVAPACKDSGTSPSLPTVTGLGMGDSHTCALTSAGAVYCWGANYNGQLGNGSTTNSAIPVAVSGGLSFTAVAADGGHTCGLTSAGAAYCWGDDYYGQLGDGSFTTTPRLTPVAVSGSLSFSAVAAGGSLFVGNGTYGAVQESHTCGLTGTGTAYCWGDNDHGELGTGSTTPTPTPLAVSGGLRFSAIVAGPIHSCGLTAAGAAYCWGANGYGQLGDGSTTTPRLIPVAVSGGLTFSALDAGGVFCSGPNPCPPGYTSHTCGLTSNRAAYCWGAGYGTAPVAVPGGLSFSALAAGRYHTCGLTSADAAYCWGADFDGQLGNGSTSSSATPVAVVGGFRFSALVADDHTCGITTTGALYCWGDNEDGQLGNGTTTSSAIPVAVAGWP